MPAKDYGIFLPIGNGGWMLSTTAPHPEATYAWNKRAALHAEEIGLDFIMSMAKWRGFGGTTDHWGRSLESMTMMSALAEATERVKIWATMHANVHNPAIAAKMYATLQDVSGGRAGMNIVNGAYAGEFEQFGIWDPTLSHADRYAMTELWTEAVTRLWTEGSGRGGDGGGAGHPHHDSWIAVRDRPMLPLDCTILHIMSGGRDGRPRRA